MPTTLLLPRELQTFLRPCSNDIVLCWSYKLRPVNPVQSEKIFLKEHIYVHQSAFHFHFIFTVGVDLKIDF